MPFSLPSFFARNVRCGLIIRVEFSENLQNSFSLTQACSLLILQPVVKRTRNAAFLNAMISEVGFVPFSRKFNTELSFQLGAVVMALGLWIPMVPNKEFTSGTLRSMPHFSCRGNDNADL